MKPTENKDSILAITLLLLVLFLFSQQDGFVYAAAVLILLCLLSPPVAAFFDFAWKKLTLGLGLVSSTVILSLIFYVIVFPLGMLLKAFKRDPLLRKLGDQRSTFLVRNKLFIKSDLKNPY